MGRKTDGVAVSIAPRERLNRVWITQRRPEDPPLQTPGRTLPVVALKNAGTVPPLFVWPNSEYPLVKVPPPESKTFSLRVISWHGISGWPEGKSTTPLFVVDPAPQ